MDLDQKVDHIIELLQGDNGKKGIITRLNLAERNIILLCAGFSAIFLGILGVAFYIVKVGVV